MSHAVKKRGAEDRFPAFQYPDPPPYSDIRSERCVVCKSQALLLPGYCRCGEPICRMCKSNHDSQCRQGRR